MVKNDLNMFLKSRDFHRKIGKAWKKGYLLYGPPTANRPLLVVEDIDCSIELHDRAEGGSTVSNRHKVSIWSIDLKCEGFFF
ncbi:hypothetical protein Hdeb2414_s0002g00058451 [Helianthus debilis subsp. tardiflorus]